MVFQPIPPLSSLHLSGEGRNKNKNNKNRIILATKYAHKTKIKIDDGESRRKIKLPKNGRGAPKCLLTPAIATHLMVGMCLHPSFIEFSRSIFIFIVPTLKPIFERCDGALSPPLYKPNIF